MSSCPIHCVLSFKCSEPLATQGHALLYMRKALIKPSNKKREQGGVGLGLPTPGIWVLAVLFRREICALLCWCHCVFNQKWTYLLQIVLFSGRLSKKTALACCILHSPLETRRVLFVSVFFLRGLFSAAVFCLQCILCNQHIIINTLAVPLRVAVSV